MELIHDYWGDDLKDRAKVYFSSIRAKYTVITSDGYRREFLTEQEADEYAEKFVIGETKWHKQLQNYQ